MNEIISELKSYLTEYECVILLASINDGSRDVIELIVGHIASEKGRVLVLSVDKATDVLSTDIDHLIISPEKQQQLLDLYYTYEFSDKFILIDDNEQYGSLYNYVRTDMISMS